MNELIWQDRLVNLLKLGCETDIPTHGISEDNAASAITLFKFVSESEPDFLLYQLSAFSWSKMVPLAVGILFATAPNNFIDHIYNREQIFRILLDKLPSQLLEFAEILKSKAFARGFGSRPQKIIRRIMETWSDQMLEEFIVGQPKATYALVKLVHPRYNGTRGNIIKCLLSGEFKN